jgi:hypothetical protein
MDVFQLAFTFWKASLISIVERLLQSKLAGRFGSEAIIDECRLTATSGSSRLRLNWPPIDHNSAVYPEIYCFLRDWA